MIDSADVFGEMIKARRRALGLTQRQLAMTINSGERFIVELEAGKSTCHLGKALAAAKAVGIDLVDARSVNASARMHGDGDLDIPEIEP